MSYYQYVVKDVLRKNIYFFSLVVLLAGLPLSKALVSIGEGLLVFSWFVAPGFKERVKALGQRKSIWIFAGSTLFVLAGLFYAENIQRNIFLITNIKISIVLFPIIIGSFEKLSWQQLKVLLWVYTLANIAATFFSLLIFFHVIEYKIANVRQIAVFVESVRFALLIVLDILFLLYAIYHSQNRKFQVLMIISIVWLVVFLGILQSLTGILALALTLLVVLLVRYRKISVYIRVAFVVLGLLSIATGAYLFKSNLNEYRAIHIENTAKLDSLTLNGNKYEHSVNDTIRVNGYLRNIYICEPELRIQWAKRSQVAFDSLDNAGWVPVKVTLVSYLTSKGLRKDSAGMSQLTDRDVRNIESGYYNYKLAEVGVNARIYDLIREFDEWRRTGIPAGSVTIRINGLKNGWKVFSEHIWFGTGYGDINDDIQAQFDKDSPDLGEDKKQNPHNQLLTIMIGSGIVGLVVFLLSFVLPGILERKYSSYLFLVSFCVVLFSFFTDDTLERMIGCVIMALFFSLFLYAVPKNINLIKK
ncbi:MAG TPA: O-antigen ligase family protein [Bacteroidales bacterium]|nr:O-antigen ligase family protein [Bacteroidales bacterium]